MSGMDLRLRGFEMPRKVRFSFNVMKYLSCYKSQGKSLIG